MQFLIIVMLVAVWICSPGEYILHMVLPYSAYLGRQQQQYSTIVSTWQNYLTNLDKQCINCCYWRIWNQPMSQMADCKVAKACLCWLEKFKIITNVDTKQLCHEFEL